MSRSFKKVPGYVDRNPFMKKYSNKLLRKASKNRLQMLSNPDEYDDKSSLFSYFKKSSVNPYDICDWRSLYFSNSHLIFTSSIRFYDYTKDTPFGLVRYAPFYIVSPKQFSKRTMNKEALRYYRKAIIK